MKVLVAAALALLVIAGCGDDSSDDSDASGSEATQQQVCEQYQDLGAEPSDSDLDALAATAESTGDAELIDEVDAAVAELKAGEDGGPAAEALATTCV